MLARFLLESCQVVSGLNLFIFHKGKVPMSHSSSKGGDTSIKGWA